MEPLVDEPARRHGVADEDMLHAYRNPIHVFDLDDGLTLIAGPDRAGGLIEVGYVVAGDGTVVIIHALRPARPKFLR